MPLDKSEIHWFPMRVTYNRELKIKELLDKEGIGNYLPMKYTIKEDGKDVKRIEVPAIHNLIFIHSSQERITNLKKTKEVFKPLRYMMRAPIHNSDKAEIITIDERQMNNFIRLASDKETKYLEVTNYLKSSGKKVRVIGGLFEGLEGVVKRIQGNKHVVVLLDSFAAVGTTKIPSMYLQIIE